MHHRLATRLAVTSAGLALAGAALLVHQGSARACGCFAPPDPSVPVVQAGERIAFHMDSGEVTAHIQIQYSGPADQFGWLLPLPSLPTMDLGTDELFAQLIQTTQPKYSLTAEYQGNCLFDPSRNGGFGSGGGGGASSPGADDSGGGGGSPLVLQDSIGPYDYAVLKADSKQPMLDWLSQNGYFIPAGTDDAVDRYIHSGAYFLALKLQKGNDAGDVQPVVVKYKSDLPMIPIVLTGVGADPDMPIMVWVLGSSRAIPRNYFHTKLDDAEIDWLNFGANYVDVVTKAVDESDGHHSFITEYAGTSDVMKDVLDYQGRFGDLDLLRGTTDPVQYVSYLVQTGYTSGGSVGPFYNPPVFTAQALAVLESYLPVPSKLLEQLVAQGGSANDYYLNFGYYVGDYRQQNPDLFTDLDLDFDPAAMTDDLDQRVVQPTLTAGAMFRAHPYLTRMFTTLSPDEMTKDPVFSFNPDLPGMSNQHTGRLIYHCGLSAGDPTTTPATIVTEDGWSLDLPDGTGENTWGDVDLPGSEQTQVEHEEGATQVVKDNHDAILALIKAKNGDDGGCQVGGGAGAGGLAGLGLAMLGLVLGLGRRRQRKSRGH